MTCKSCGDKKKKCATKDFTKAVIEINNPESLVLLRKVVIPLSMGDETQVPPAIGKYRNVILYYEANKHVYLYSSDGIPTQLEMPQEVFERLTALESETVYLQQEIDDIKNSPDVVDIVATYEALQAYDTSSLGDNDIIRVLVDETHNGDSSYYRWNKTNSQWVFIGSIDVINIVQTTGTSTTEVMSQKAVTDNLPSVFTTNDWNALWT